MAILFRTFLDRPKYRLNLDPRSPILLQKYFKQYKKIMGTSFNTIIFVNLESKQFEKMKIVKHYAPFVFFEMLSASCVLYFVKMRIGKWWRLVKQNLQNLGCAFHIYQKTLNRNLLTFLFSSKGTPSTPQHFDSQPCTRLPPLHPPHIYSHRSSLIP